MQGRFGGAPFRDVAHVQQQGGFAVIFHPAGAHLDGDAVAVGGQAFAFGPEQFSTGQLFKIPAGLLATGRGDEVVQGVFADQLFAGHAVQHAGGQIHVQHRALQVFDKNGIGRVFKQIAETNLAFAQILLGVDAFQRAAALVGQGLQRFQITIGVAAGHTVLNKKRAQNVLAFADGREHGDGGKWFGFKGHHQFRALVDDAPNEGIGGFRLGR